MRKTAFSDGSDTFPITFPTRVCIESLGTPVTPVILVNVWVSNDGSDTFPITFPTRVCIESLGRPVTPVILVNVWVSNDGGGRSNVYSRRGYTEQVIF